MNPTAKEENEECRLIKLRRMAQKELSNLFLPDMFHKLCIGYILGHQGVTNVDKLMEGASDLQQLGDLTETAQYALNTRRQYATEH